MPTTFPSMYAMPCAVSVNQTRIRLPAGDRHQNGRPRSCPPVRNGTERPAQLCAADRYRTPPAASASTKPTTAPGTSVCIAEVIGIPCRSRRSSVKRSMRCSSSTEQASVCSWNGIAVTSMRPARASATKRSTAAGSRESSQRRTGSADSTVHRKRASSGHCSVAVARSRAESRYSRWLRSTTPCRSV
jgi:hypothetical protein